jgi:hypothetical protein
MDNTQDNELAKKMQALAGIKEGDKKFLKNESFAENTKEETEPGEKPDSDFIIMEFEQEEVEPGPDDGTLYKLD